MKLTFSARFARASLSLITVAMLPLYLGWYLLSIHAGLQCHFPGVSRAFSPFSTAGFLMRSNSEQGPVKLVVTAAESVEALLVANEKV
jgi:hypothetical protein